MDCQLHPSLSITSFLIISILATTRGILLHGYDDERTLHLCASETRNIICETGKFIYIRSTVMGVSLSYTPTVGPGQAQCPIDVEDDCQESYSSLYLGTTYRSFSGIAVPNATVPCMEDELLVNYVHVEYSCIVENLLDAQEMCYQSMRMVPEGYIATPNFPLVAPNTLYDCTCTVRQSSMAPMNVTVLLLYASLPGPNCNEQVWIEDPDGNRKLEFCSPTLPVRFSENLYVREVKFRFVRSAIPDDYETSDHIKVWYGIEAPTLMEITCGPSNGTTIVTSDSDQLLIPNPAGPSNGNTEQPPIPTTNGDNMPMDKDSSLYVTIGAAAGASVFIITVAVVTGILCVRRYGSRKPDNGPERRGNAEGRESATKPPVYSIYDEVTEVKPCSPPDLDYEQLVPPPVNIYNS